MLTLILIVALIIGEVGGSSFQLQRKVRAPQRIRIASQCRCVVIDGREVCPVCHLDNNL